MRELALPVRHRRRHPIGIQPHAAHAEGGTRAKAAHRQLGVLCIVLAIAGQQARHGSEALGQIHPCTGAVRLQIHAIQRGRRIKCRHAGQPRCFHRDPIQSGGLLGLGRQSGGKG